MNRIVSIVLLLCAPALADTVISMPPPPSDSPAITPVMSMVNRAMQQSARAGAGLQALDRYTHARQVPYNVYSLDAAPSYGFGRRWDAGIWYETPRPRWGYSWGWWGWTGCIIVNVDSHSSGAHCGAPVSPAP